MNTRFVVSVSLIANQPWKDGLADMEAVLFWQFVDDWIGDGVISMSVGDSWTCCEDLLKRVKCQYW
jgi:hypothetical protein